MTPTEKRLRALEAAAPSPVRLRTKEERDAAVAAFRKRLPMPMPPYDPKSSFTREQHEAMWNAFVRADT